MFKLETSGDILTYGTVKAGVGSVQLAGTKMTVHSYCVDGVLIDTGAKSLYRAMQPFFAGINYDRIVLTHYHEDHTGNVDMLVNVPVYIHEIAQPLTARNPAIPHYRKMYWQQPPAFASQPLPKTFRSINDTWEVIETPGHTKDHVAFLNKDIGAVFTGDLFVTPKPKIVLIDENIIDTYASLQRLNAVDFDTLYCAHAGQLANGKDLLAMKINYLEHLIERVLHARDTGLSIDEITEQILPHEPPMVAFSGREWDAVHMVRAILNYAT